MRYTYWEKSPRGFANETDIRAESSPEGRASARAAEFRRISRRQARKILLRPDLASFGGEDNYSTLVVDMRGYPEDKSAWFRPAPAR